MLNDIQKEQLHFMGRRSTRVAVLRLPQPMMAEGHLTISATIREVDGSSSSEESTSARRRRHRDAIVFSVDGAVASAAKQNVVSDHYVQSVVAHSMMAAFSSSPSSPTSISISESTDPPVEGDSTVTAAFSVPQESLRQLRRKQRISLPKRPSWRSLRKTLSKSSVASPGSDHAQKPQGPPALEVEALARPASPPIRHKWVPRRPLDRPLYTAIRKNMSPSPPSTPSSSPVHSTFSAASATHLGGRKSCDTPPSFIRSSDEWVSRPPCYPHTIGTGFSLSGETELRMALARRNTVGGSGSRSQYRYHETKNPSKIKETMMKIGQSLKDLVNMSRRI
ncbi:hypothetical protein PHLCEN_2v9995 [Hermanssonia centrifuga]|uniref:Uncharacterized protein n=1 Tax=Hermanssonia centrifuga TaxID=98765 RepID=A0A2R6NP58_9APHY|nr:hypothetical protein PHLCEN_2v9995 [Hermanssonia centrifuga]